MNLSLITVMAWVNPTAIISATAPNHWTDLDSIYDKAGSDDDSVRLALTGGDGIHWYFDTGSDFNLSVPDAGVQLGEWQHIAGTFDGTTSRVFLNGEQIAEMPASGTIITNTNSATVAGGSLESAVDELKIFDAALTPDEIGQIMAGGRSPIARKPSPGNGDLVSATWANLSWTPGGFAVSHDIYLGESFDDVNSGTVDTFQGNQAGTFLVVGFPGFPYPDGLVPGTTYYWRIDEVNDANAASPWKGEIWSFSIPSNIAYAPVPADGAKFVEPEPTLTWLPGFGAKFHTVYFSDSFDDVSSAEGGVPQVGASFVPGALELDKTYYWRVDEFIGTATNRGDVWSFTTLPLIPPTDDADLVAWWRLDEGTGSTALDWSGNGNHVTLFGSEWVTPGVLGDAALSIGRYGAIQNLNYAASDLTEVTVTAWVRTSSPGDQYIVSFDRNEYYRLEINGDGGGPGQIGWDVMTSSGQIDYGSVTRVDDGRWHHITGVFANGTATIYIDGAPEPSATGGPTFGTGTTRFGYIGANSEATDFNVGRGGGSPVEGEVADIRIYHRALTLEEIQLIMRGDPRLAWGPSPSDGSTPDIDNATPLSWSAGDDATSHEVYFGTDEETVKNADTSDTTGIYQGRQNATSFTPAEGVEWGGGPYFWRVDENNNDGTVTKGRVWRLTVADFILVDDFESYTDDDAANQAIWQHWIDGFGVATNGAQ
ncbi:MAG: LamG domain-containing protein, partial [Planctomycetota bacterium]